MLVTEKSRVSREHNVRGPIRKIYKRAAYIVAQPVDDLGERVGGHRSDDQDVGPAAQLDVQDARAAPPGLQPLGGVVVHGVDAGQVQQRRDGRLLGGLAGQEVLRRLRQDDPDREPGGVGAKGLDDLGDFDRCHGAGCDL